MTMHVYRIEDEYGVGPYSHSTAPNISEYCHRRMAEMPQHPSPYYDIGPRWLMEFHEKAGGSPLASFGFVDPLQLCEWFNSEARRELTKLAELDKVDLRISVFEVAEKYVLEGKQQVVFARGSSEQLLRLPLYPFDSKALRQSSVT